MVLPAQRPPKSLPELLEQRREPPRSIKFLNTDGEVISSLTYAELYDEAQKIGSALLDAGLVSGGHDIVVANFEDQKKHITLFWGCCFAGVPFSPIPPFHPDPSRQTLLLEHLQQLFHKPTFIADGPTLEKVTALLPEAKTLEYSDLIRSATKIVASSSVYPEREPDPKETVALMLTSGSTGHSKGVVLSHAMVISAIRGKAEMHNTNRNSVFLNWINFDHVANVTEIHLHALYAGASQYQVSPAAIIRRPRNLLDWCSKYQVTNSFSPNFLLAQICRDTPLPATKSVTSKDVPSWDLSSLRVLITGGEANPVGTAIHFSDLIERFGSPRTTLRAAFGMTETGAGSIYNLQPIAASPEEYARSYMAVGKPHSFMQMRTVNLDTGDVCPPATPGFLQVSGPCVFSQYYANPEVTQSSFSEDGWFTTGDVGVIDENGQLHMLGRDKDDINVNGVKHPCVDVEHYIQDSKIPGVEVSFVLVSALRLDGADTETYVVFYRHSSVFTEPINEGRELKESQVGELLATNRGIKNICSVFCSQAPHAILPLPRQYFVKTALGKISRSALAKAYGAGKFSAIEAFLAEATDAAKRKANHSGEARSAFDEVLCEGVSHVFELDPHTIELHMNLFDVGASSMHLIRLKQFLQDRFRIPDIPTIEMLKRPVLSELSSYVQTLLSEDSDAVKGYNPLVCFTSQGSKPPLYLVHPGVGEVLIFINLARILDDDRPVYALRARGFEEGEVPPANMQEMVDIYAEAIEANNPNGPYFLAGYSFGGAVAFEIGKKLERKGKRVAWVGILNLPPYIQFRVRELVWVETMLNLSMFLGLVKSEQFDDFKDRLLKAFPEGAQDTEPSCSKQIIEWTYAHCDQQRLQELSLPTDSFYRWINVAYDVSYTGRNYVPSEAVWGALTTVFCAVPLPSMGTREEYKRNRLAKWQAFSGEHFEMIDVDGEHYTMISEEHVQSFAPRMKAAIHRAEELLTKPALTGPKLSPIVRADFDAVPTVDFSLAESKPEDYYRQLKFALEDVGFGIFINVPGFEPEFQRKVFELQAKMFAKPQEWKDTLGTDKSASLRGYFRADGVAPPHKAYAEAFRFGAERPPRHEDDPFWLRIHEGPNQWPSEGDVPEFRQTFEDLLQRYHQLNLELNQHIARLLDVPQSFIDDYYPSPPEFNAAMWHYFPITPELKATAKDGFVNGMHEHRDPSTFLTCLIQSRPGLQVKNHQGQWIDIPMVEGGVVCNVGLQMMRLTGGKLVATTHRVNTLKIEDDRYTIPYVLTTKLDKAVVPLEKFDDPNVAKLHVQPSPKVLALMAVEDPLVRSGYARLSLFPGAAMKMYPKEWEEAKRLGIV